MSKILKVCNSEFLPSMVERDVNCVYFVYDKMAIYLGKNFYSDPFCVVESMPEDPVEGMLYITLDGYLKSYFDYKIIDIGQIESEDQIEILKKAGTSYFMKAEYRYLDLQHKTIQLPYQNGNFQLSVNLLKDIMIDENTTIRFNPKTNRFEIDGVVADEVVSNDALEGYTGVDSNSISTKVVDKVIRADLIISPKEGNLLTVYDNGVYANLSNSVQRVEFNQLAGQFVSYKDILNSYIRDIENTIGDIEDNILGDSLTERILEELRKYEPTIDDLLSNYNQISTWIDDLKVDHKKYTDDAFDAAKTEIINYLKDLANAWDDFENGNAAEEIVVPLSEGEAYVQSRVLSAMRKQFSTLRSINNDSTVIARGWTNSEIFTTDSEPAVKIGYTFISPRINTLPDGHRLIYAIEPEKEPEYLENLASSGYNIWDNTSAIEAKNGAVIYLVDVDDNYIAQRMSVFPANSRTEDDNKGIELLNVEFTNGSAENSIQPIITDVLDDGCIYMYKGIGSVPQYGIPLDEEYKKWNGISEIDVTDMNTLCLVVCTSDRKKPVKMALYNL